MKKPKITIAEIEHVVFFFTEILLKWDEPIPGFNSRFPNILESCLATPFQTFSKKGLYKSFIEKAAVLFYLMIKNHPFQNGNKRIAMITLFYFLYKNKKWLRVDTKELYNFAKWVAESNPKLKEETLLAIIKILKTYLIDFKQ